MRPATETLTALLRWYQDRFAPWQRVAAALLWAGLIWWASSQPSEPKPYDPLYSYAWNLGHVVVFGVLAALVQLSTQGSTVPGALLSVFVTAAYGAIDELHQGSVKGRAMDAWDVCSDGLGACIASCALLWLLGGRRGAGLLLLVFVPLAALSVYMAA